LHDPEIFAKNGNRMKMQAYPILHPDEQKEERSSVCALAVMAKAPRAGKVKTRLCPPLMLEESAALNVCFLRDTTANIADVTQDGLAAGLICYTPVGDETAFNGLLPEGFALIPQRGQTFGERLSAAVQDILSCGYGSVCLIDSDSPTLPTFALRQAVEALKRPGDRVVLGGSEDGGYYLIGLKQAHEAPFQGIAWSTNSVYGETVERISAAHLELVELPMWYDVDDAATLSVLEAELLDGQRPRFADINGYDALSTKDYLASRRRSSAVESTRMSMKESGGE
jgi:rSAM/selenodomain-associated transferase 1